MNDADQMDDRPARGTSELAPGRAMAGVTTLKPKGACYYCNQPLDNVRRFCSKSCADDYRTEEEAFNSGAS